MLLVFTYQLEVWHLVKWSD